MEKETGELIKSLNRRLTTLEQGFSSTHEKEGLYERLRGLEKFRKRVRWFVTAVVGGAISLVLKFLFL